MNTLTDLIDRYIAAWNEPDTDRRRDLIARTYAEGANYLDPMLQAEGRDGIDAMIVSVRNDSLGIVSAAPVTSRAITIGCASPGT